MNHLVNSVARLQNSFGPALGLALAAGILLCAALVAYLAGCFNGAVIISKYVLHNDVRNHGSGNAGLTNFHRVFGGPLTFAVLLTDVLKAVLAVLAGGALVGLA
ncbi:MAG: glycerol-3-phosphate acyltransferase, partial [Oscillospiraceae bacterium]|nr:glycerol-3-phosphate acyltransferase [Oscillospiraceae bacterium]